jgi:hypothetical protein
MKRNLLVDPPAERVMTKCPKHGRPCRQWWTQGRGFKLFLWQYCTQGSPLEFLLVSITDSSNSKLKLTKTKQVVSNFNVVVTGKPGKCKRYDMPPTIFDKIV